MDKPKDELPPSTRTVTVLLTRAFRRAIDWRTLTIWFACALLATYSGPFGTYKSYSSLELLGTWIVLLGAGILIAYIVDEFIEYYLINLTQMTRLIVFLGIAALLIGSAIDALLVYFFAHPSSVTPSWAELSLYTLGAMVFVVVLRHVLQLDDVLADVDASGENSKAKPRPASLPAHSRLAIRLNIPQGDRISQIAARGHFVDVHTCAQTYSTRMRFSDAVAELDGTYGLTVHRSHWVHWDSITGWVPCAKKPYILLNNGETVPVSKSNLAKVKNAGLVEIPTEELAQKAVG